MKDFALARRDTFCQSIGHAKVHIANGLVYEFICIGFLSCCIWLAKDVCRAWYCLLLYINRDTEKKGKDREIAGGLERAEREKVNDVCKVKAAAILSSTPLFHPPSTLNGLISLFKCLNIPKMTRKKRDNFHYTE